MLIRNDGHLRDALERMLPFTGSFGAAFFLFFQFATTLTAVTALILFGGVVVTGGAVLGRRWGGRAVAPLCRLYLLAMTFAWPVLTPAVVALLNPPELAVFMTSSAGEEWYEFATLDPLTAGDIAGAAMVAMYVPIVVWVAVTAGSLFVTAFGVLRIVRLTLRHAVSDVPLLVSIQGQALPAMVFLTLFGFLNADVWQFCDRLTARRLIIALIAFAVVTLLATNAQLKVERDEVKLAGSRDLMAKLTGTPFEGKVRPDVATQTRPAVPDLTRVQRLNTALALTARQLTRATAVGLAVFVFLAFLGYVLIDEATMTRWIGAAPAPWWSNDTLNGPPVALMNAALLMASFAATYFSVVSMTDPAYRSRVFGPVVADLGRVSAVHALYHQALGVRPETYAGAGL